MGLGLAEMLIGKDPLKGEELWERMYIGSAMNSRRGAVIHAMGALDIASRSARQSSGQAMLRIAGRRRASSAVLLAGDCA